MSYCISLLQDISLQQRVLHELAKLFWGTFVLRELHEEEEISMTRKTEMIVIHRDAVLNNLPQILNDISKEFSTNFPKLLISEVINAIYNLQQGYYEALVWEEKYRYSLPLTTCILNPVTAGKYQASYFIEPTGHFNDLAWVKLFVTDERIDAKCRFRLACFYCLDDVLLNIWSTLEYESRDPFDFALHNLRSQNEPYCNLDFFWACTCENYFGQPGKDLEKKLNEMNISNLCQAISVGHEYAVQFFWKRCSDSQKDIFLNNSTYDCIESAAYKNSQRIVHFLYFVLTLKHENTHLLMEYYLPYMGNIWSCLLNSQFYNCTLNDILTFPESIPISVYFDIFKSLISNIEIFNYPIQKTIFKTIWNRLSHVEQTEVLKMSSFIISTFVRLKELDLLEAIIKPISYPVKDRLLLNDWQAAGRSALYEISKGDDYDAILRYLLFFLIGEDSSTQRINLRANAKDILENLKEEIGPNWSEVNDLAKQLVCKVVDNLQECLSILNDVINTIPESNI